MKKIKLYAGVPSRLDEQGRFFRILSANNEVDVVFNSSITGNQWELKTPLLSGVGLNFVNRPSPFTSFTITSDVDQIVEYFAGVDIADDDRLAASATVTVSSTASGSSTPVKQTLNDTVNGANVLDYSENRKEATLQLSGECYIQSVDDGIVVNGSIQWNNRGALKLIPLAAGVEVRVLEEFS